MPCIANYLSTQTKVNMIELSQEENTDDIVDDLLNVTSSQVECNVSFKIQDLDLDHGDVYKLEKNGRSESMLKLVVESFSPDGSKKNQFAFLTDRPFEWFKAFKEYITSNDLNNRCHKNQRNYSKTKKVSIIKVSLAFESS